MSEISPETYNYDEPITMDCMYGYAHLASTILNQNPIEWILKIRVHSIFCFIVQMSSEKEPPEYVDIDRTIQAIEQALEKEHVSGYDIIVRRYKQDDDKVTVKDGDSQIEPPIAQTEENIVTKKDKIKQTDPKEIPKKIVKEKEEGAIGESWNWVKIKEIVDTMRSIAGDIVGEKGIQPNEEQIHQKMHQIQRLRNALKGLRVVPVLTTKNRENSRKRRSTLQSAIDVKHHDHRQVRRQQSISKNVDWGGWRQSVQAFRTICNIPADRSKPSQHSSSKNNSSGINSVGHSSRVTAGHSSSKQSTRPSSAPQQHQLEMEYDVTLINSTLTPESINENKEQDTNLHVDDEIPLEYSWKNPQESPTACYLQLCSPCPGPPREFIFRDYPPHFLPSYQAPETKSERLAQFKKKCIEENALHSGIRDTKPMTQGIETNSSWKCRWRQIQMTGVERVRKYQRR